MQDKFLQWCFEYGIILKLYFEITVNFDIDIFGYLIIDMPTTSIISRFKRLPMLKLSVTIIAIVDSENVA